MNGSNQPEWRMEHGVCSYDVDPNQTVHLSALCRYMQEAAFNHAEHLGWGHALLMERGLAWVLARKQIRVGVLPKWGARVEVRTWPSGWDRLFYYRDFRLTDREGRVVLEASSAWSLINVEKRERVHPALDIEVPDGKRVFADRPPRIKKSCDEPPCLELSVAYGDLDMNGHVNNVRYIDWILNSFPLEFHRAHAIRELDINYLAEVIHGQTVAICCGREEPLRFGHSVRSGDVEFIRARSVWRKNGDEA